MDDLKFIIAHNIVDLRKQSGITQAELAEKLNYSDKAISKWERGESLPDVVVMKQIADLFEVNVDYLLTEDHTEYKRQKRFVSRRRKRNHLLIMLMSIVLVVGVALFVFVNMNFFDSIQNKWFAFVVAVPIMCIVWLVFNSIWFNRRLNYVIISILMWTILASVFLAVAPISKTAWQLFLLGIPGQIVILLWSKLKPTRRK